MATHSVTALQTVLTHFMLLPNFNDGEA